MKRKSGIAVIATGCTLILFALLLKSYMFGFSNLDGNSHVTVYAYTLSTERTKEKIDALFGSGIFALEIEEAEKLRPSDISAVYLKVYLSGNDYVKNTERTFIDRYYRLFLITMGCVIVIMGINLASGNDEE